jgi:hypothetical protein
MICTRKTCNLRTFCAYSRQYATGEPFQPRLDNGVCKNFKSYKQAVEAEKRKPGRRIWEGK